MELGKDATDTGRLIERKYRMGRVVRESPHAVTYRAEHIGIQRFVDVSILRATLPSEGTEAAKLVREGRVAGSIPHRNVQSVVDSGVDDDGRPFVVWEALDGQTLSEVVAENPQGISADRAGKIVMQVLEGLHSVHTGGVVHRALGPDCVLVVPVRGGDELVKICQFDEAVFRAEIANAMPVTRPVPAAYRAPESEITPLLDLYSTGVMLRHLLSGTLEPRVGAVGDTARRAIARATAKHRELRFADAELMLHAVALLVSTTTRSARDSSRARSDPLAADFEYLQHRRKLGHIGRTTRVGETRIPLLPVLLAIEAIYKELGDAQWSELVHRHPEVEEWLPGAGNTETNRQRGIAVGPVAQMLATADDLGGHGDLAMLVGVGERVARRGLRRLIPSLVEHPTPDLFVDRFGDLWGKMVGQGEVVVLERDAGAALLAIRGQTDPKLELCAMVGGCARTAMVEAGGQDVVVHVPACQGVGDATTVFSLRWRP